jgi:hypothetical protein
MTLLIVWKEEGPPLKDIPREIRTQDVDMTIPYLSKSCAIGLPCPAAGRGTYYVSCDKCFRTFAVPATGQTDDPKSITISCWYGWDSHYGNA